MNIVRCNLTLDFKLHYKAKVTNTVMYKTEMSNNDPSLKNPGVNPHSCLLHLASFRGISTYFMTKMLYSYQKRLTKLAIYLKKNGIRFISVTLQDNNF